MKETCPVSRRCGGCAYIEGSYENSLLQKYDALKNIYHTSKIEPFIGMQNPYHYRHKVYASFGYNSKHKLVAGMYQEDSHKPVFFDHCLIQDELANKIINEFCRIADSMHIEAYDENNRRGVLRHLYIRTSADSKKAMAVIVIGSRELPGSRKLISLLRTACPEIITVILDYNNARTSMVLSGREKTLFGPGYLNDRLNGLTFSISPRSFFQVNPAQTEVLYKKAIELAALEKVDKVIDVCCGIGTITLLAASYCNSALGIEIVPQAIADAKSNAMKNNVKNVRFVCADANEQLKRYAEGCTAAILDPARAGLEESALKALAEAKIKRIVYISCNPLTHARDLEVLKRCGYKVKTLQPVDMFPFTKHVETVALLVRTEGQ